MLVILVIVLLKRKKALGRCRVYFFLKRWWILLYIDYIYRGE